MLVIHNDLKIHYTSPIFNKIDLFFFTLFFSFVILVSRCQGTQHADRERDLQPEGVPHLWNMSQIADEEIPDELTNKDNFNISKIKKLNAIADKIDSMLNDKN